MNPHEHAHEHHPGPRTGSRTTGLRHRIGHLLAPHSHGTTDRVDPALETSALGLRTLWVSAAVLGATTLVQALVVACSGSVALLGDTIHNAADALTALPLATAFLLGRRAATRRYTYGYGRAEDLAGILIVLIVAASCAASAWAAVSRLHDPRAVSYPGVVALAAVVGFVGNEGVARYRIRTGRRIGSAALEADGLHARTDAFTSLAVLAGAGGSAVGLPWADPVVGLLITVAIAAVTGQAARQVAGRLMDCVDPAVVDRAEVTLREVPGVLGVGQVRMRWVGHVLRAEADVVVDPALTVVRAHDVTVRAEHALLHAVDRLGAVTVHVDHLARGEQGGEPVDPHALLEHHRPTSR
jgi:cation diffusion facilitator family transporter